MPVAMRVRTLPKNIRRQSFRPSRPVALAFLEPLLQGNHLILRERVRVLHVLLDLIETRR